MNKLNCAGWVAGLIENKANSAFNPIKVGGSDQLQDLDHLNKIRKKMSPLKSNLLPIYFIVLKSSMGIFRKSQKVSAFNFDPKGV